MNSAFSVGRLKNLLLSKPTENEESPDDQPTDPATTLMLMDATFASS